jgi:hypothetical protein
MLPDSPKLFPTGLAFLHIPKTAGTSLREALTHNPAAPPLLVFEGEESVFHLGDDEYPLEGTIFGHLSWQMGNALGADTVATVLREPVARCLSQIQHWFYGFGHLKETDDSGWYSRVVVSERGFIWNIENLLDRPDMPQYRALANAQVAQLARHHRYRPDRLDESWLELAAANLDLCAAVGITERMPAFLSQFGSLLGVELELGHYNIGHQRSDELAEALPEPVRAKLLRANELDAELYRRAAERANEAAPRQVSIPALPIGPRLRADLNACRAERDAFERWEGDFRLRLCHFVADIAEIQVRFGIPGDFFLDRPSRPREAALVAGLRNGGRLWTTGEAIDTAVFSDFAVVGATDPEAGRCCIPEARVLAVGTVAALRLGLVQGRSRDGRLERVLDAIAPALVPLGVVVVLNALAQGGASKAGPVLSDLARMHGLSVAICVDEHAVLCRREWVWFYHALARAKFTGLEIIRTRQDADDVLEVHSDY